MDKHEKKVLEEIAEKSFENKHEDRKRKKAQSVFDKLFSEAEILKELNFFCVYCRKDFTASAFKTSAQNEIFYRTNHECGKECVRRWTERPEDEFYCLSFDILRERQEYADDTLSPYQSRFRVLYDDPADKSSEAELKHLEETLYAKHCVEGAKSFKPNQLKSVVL